MILLSGMTGMEAIVDAQSVAEPQGIACCCTMLLLQQSKGSAKGPCSFFMAI
jgi:hypothetical protein